MSGFFPDWHGFAFARWRNLQDIAAFPFGTSFALPYGMTSKQAIAKLKQELEYTRMLKDRAKTKARYNKLRDKCDELAYKLQKLGILGALDLEALAGKEED